jgi:hypothetical protein
VTGSVNTASLLLLSFSSCPESFFISPSVSFLGFTFSFFAGFDSFSAAFSLTSLYVESFAVSFASELPNIFTAAIIPIIMTAAIAIIPITTAVFFFFGAG